MARIRKPARARTDNDQITDNVDGGDDYIHHERAAAIIAQRDHLTREEMARVNSPGRICATYRKPMFVVHGIRPNNHPKYISQTFRRSKVYDLFKKDQGSDHGDASEHSDINSDEEDEPIHAQTSPPVNQFDQKLAEALEKIGRNTAAAINGETDHPVVESGLLAADRPASAATNTHTANIALRTTRPRRTPKPTAKAVSSRPPSVLPAESQPSVLKPQPSIRLDADQHIKERFAPRRLASINGAFKDGSDSDHSAKNASSTTAENPHRDAINLSAIDQEHYVEVYGCSPPPYLAALKLLTDYQPESELPPPFMDDMNEDSEFEDEADELLHDRYLPLPDAQDFIKVLSQPLAWRSRDALYALAANTQRALKAWQDEYLALDQRTAIRSNPVKKPAIGARLPMDPAVYDDMKEADLYGYIYDSRKPPGTQDPYRQKANAPDMTNGRELRNRRGRDVGQDATDDEGHASETNKRARRPVQRYDGAPRASSRGRKRAHESDTGDMLETPRKRGRPAPSRNSSFGPGLKHQTLKITLGSHLREESLQPGTATETESRMGTPDPSGRRRGRPPGSRNLAPRSDAGIKKGPRKNKAASQDSDMDGGDLIEDIDEEPPVPDLPPVLSPRIQVQEASPVRTNESRQPTPFTDDLHGLRDSPAPSGSQKDRKPRAKSEKRSESMQKWWAARKVKLEEVKRRQEEERLAEAAKHAPLPTNLPMMNGHTSAPTLPNNSHERTTGHENGHKPSHVPASRRRASPKKPDVPQVSSRPVTERVEPRVGLDRFGGYREPSFVDSSIRHSWPEARPSEQRLIDQSRGHVQEQPHYMPREVPGDSRLYQHHRQGPEPRYNHHRRQSSHGSVAYDGDRGPPSQWTAPRDAEYRPPQQQHLPPHSQYTQGSPDRRSQTLPSPHLLHLPYPPLGSRGFPHQATGPSMGPPPDEWQHARRSSNQGPLPPDRTRGYPPSTANMQPQGSPLPPPPPGYMYGPPTSQGPPPQLQYHQQPPPQQRPLPPLSPRNSGQAYYSHHDIPPHSRPYPGGAQSPPQYSRQQGLPPPPPLPPSQERQRGYSQSSSHGPPPPSSLPPPDRFIHQAPGPPPQLPPHTAPFQGFSHTFAPALPHPPPNSFSEASQSQHRRNKSSGQTYQFIAPASGPGPSGRSSNQHIEYANSHASLPSVTAEPKKRSRTKSNRGTDGDPRRLEGRSEKVR